MLPNPNGKIPRNRFTGEPSQNDYDKTLASIGYEFRHDFASGLAFNQNLRYGKADIDNNGANVGSFGLLADQRTLLRYLFPNENHTRTFGVDNNLQYIFDSGRVQHVVLAGVDYRRSKDDYASAFDFDAPALDVFDPVYGSPLTIPAYTNHTLQTRRICMPQISEGTLIIAIQAVAAEIRVLREATKNDGTMAGVYQQLEDLIEAAEDLERAYDVAARTMLNLPPYDELIGG